MTKHRISGPPAPAVFVFGIMTGAALGYGFGAREWPFLAAAALFVGLWIITEE